MGTVGTVGTEHINNAETTGTEHINNVRNAFEFAIETAGTEHINKN